MLAAELTRVLPELARDPAPHAAPTPHGHAGRAGEEGQEARAGNAGGAVVLGLVRGGVPVAAEVAGRLGLPLDVLVVRKLGVPWAPEVAFGALGPGGVRVANPEGASHLREPE